MQRGYPSRISEHLGRRAPTPRRRVSSIRLSIVQTQLLVEVAGALQPPTA